MINFSYKFQFTALILVIILISSSCSSDNTVKEYYDDGNLKAVGFVKKMKWFNWNQSDNQTTKQIISKQKSLFNFISNKDKLDNYLHDFHVIDIDDDNDLDIVYNGWSGGESKILLFYLNKNGKYIKSKSLYGEIVTIDNSNIVTLDLPGCCGDFEIKSYQFKLLISDNSIGFKLLSSIIRHGETIKPIKFFKEPISFKVKNSPYYLRVTPEINPTELYFPWSEEPDNIYLTYESGNTGRALGQTIDETGRVWWYVEMDSTPKHNRKDENFINIEPCFIGWMSSRYLEKASN